MGSNQVAVTLIGSFSNTLSHFTSNLKFFKNILCMIIGFEISKKIQEKLKIVQMGNAECYLKMF